MSECKCDLRTKLVGDGCSKCNPQFYIEHLQDALKDEEAETSRLREQLKVAVGALEKLRGMQHADDALAQIKALQPSENN